MRVIEKTVYQFDELSEQAKEKAREWFRSSWDSADLDCVIADFVHICEIIGVRLAYSSVKLMNGKTRQKPNIYYSVNYCQSDYAAFEGAWFYEKGCKKAIREYAPMDNELHKIVDAWCELQKRNFYQLRANCSERCGSQHVNEVYRYDDKEVDREPESEVGSLVDDLAGWLYSTLESEVDYQTKDETVDENIRANEYEFYESGEIA